LAGFEVGRFFSSLYTGLSDIAYPAAACPGIAVAASPAAVVRLCFMNLRLLAFMVFDLLVYYLEVCGLKFKNSERVSVL
jgi:hypothetical protein